MFTQCVSGVLILSSPPSATLLSFIWKFLLILNTTCSPCVWAFLSIRATHGALLLLPRHRARPWANGGFMPIRDGAWLHGPWRVDLDSFTMCQMFRAWPEKYVFFYFWKLSWHQQPRERTCTDARTRSGAAGRPLDRSVLRCISLVQILSTAYFSTSTMKRSQSRLHSLFTPLILFFLLQWSFFLLHIWITQ